MKKLLNNPRNVVREMLEGLADLIPGLALLEHDDVIVRSDIPPAALRQVAVISGGGAGHEPAHAGYVGAGMLHAAVVGDVFTSPSVDAVLAAIQAVAGPRGVVLIVKNYTGDRLNFGLAAELARAAGIPAEIVVVADDVALRDTVSPERRRGIAGTVLVHKVTGALAANGAPIAEVATAGRAAATLVGTMGVALGACTVPAAGRPGFTLGEDEIELGLGIHGEQGVARGKLQPANVLVETMLDAILADKGLGAGDRAVLLVNNLGGTTPMELTVMARWTLAELRRRGIVIERAWMGVLLSALEMPGCSLSLMKVDDAMLAGLDAATTAPAWPGDGHVPPARTVLAGGTANLLTAEQNRSSDSAGPAIRTAALACAAALSGQEQRLTELDSAAGDGDLGISMARGAAGIRAFCVTDRSPDAASALTGIAGELRRAIAGSSGPFYAVGLLRAARHLAACQTIDAGAWAAAFAKGIEGVAELGGARPGDRTMLDALQPAVDAFLAGLARKEPVASAWTKAVRAAEDGAQATAGMRPRLGRASYLGDRVAGIPDAGAVAACIWLGALTMPPRSALED